jgi:hypothetical protein
MLQGVLTCTRPHCCIAAVVAALLLLSCARDRSVSPLPGHGAVLRFAAERTEDAYALLHDTLAPLQTMLGVAPYTNDYY